MCCRWRRRGRIGLAGKEHTPRPAIRVQIPVDHHMHRVRLCRTGINGNENLAVVENPGKCDYASRVGRIAEIYAVAAALAEILPAIAQAGLALAQVRQILDQLVELVGAGKDVWAAPKRLAHVFTPVAMAVHALLGAVIDTRDSQHGH